MSEATANIIVRLQSENAKLREQLSLVEEENRQFKELFKPTPDNPYNFTPTENTIFTLLRRGHIVANETILSAITFTVGSEAPTKETLRVHIHRIRRKIAPVRVICHVGLGYSLVMDEEPVKKGRK